ncbi:MAG TPA: hypothetical protein QF517_11435, partial [Pseudomonadales bacterium]|nr:hypothetical protein [Pseudomonadales bacterium]
IDDGNNFIYGCTDSNACNYDSEATDDNGSCEYDVDCAGECGGTAEIDECGVCGGNGIQNGDCDCDGNVDLGCGCGEAGPSGCDNACGSTLADDECGICGGDNTSCADCAGVPNGSSVEDECGLCDGPGPDAGHDCDDNCIDPNVCGSATVSFSNVTSGSADVLYSSNVDVYGFQFNV